MSFIAKLQRGREVLEQQRRLSVRALGRELGVSGDELDELVEELIDVQQVARRAGVVLEWVGGATEDRGGGSQPVVGPSAASPLSGARKMVTVAFADLAGSTALHERIDPESARGLMESYYATLRAAVERHGGTVVKLLGDGVLAAFGVPQVAEDDAIRAVHAGVAMQEAFGALVAGQPTVLGAVGLRVAINTGEVVVSGANDDVVGDPVNVAARLQQEARNGDVVVGEATRRLVDALVTLEPLGSFALRGRAESVKAYRVVSLEPPGRATAAAFVGRTQELARITTVYERAVGTPAAHLVVLLGSPGLGKSRLIGEFARRTAATATVVVARCDAAGGATFAPVAEGVRELLGIEAGASTDRMRSVVENAVPVDDAERARIAVGIVGLLAGAPGLPQETFFVVRRFLAGLTRTRPVVLVIDDLQWAEPLLLDLVEHLVQWGRGLPLLVLIGARPELRGVRSTFATPGGLVSDVLALDGLDAGAAMQLAAGVIGAADLPAAVAAKVLATSEGNPLFIGELVRMLVDEGALTRDGDRWTAGETLATVEMPPTIHALLAARIERLAPVERDILERASVVGRHFSRSALAALLSTAGALDAQLESLQRAELIERDTGWFLGEPALRFHHVLIRDAAYRRLLKGTRAELHERLAGWIEARVGDVPEHDETIGRHLEEAHRLLGELGPIDGTGQRLGERAATRLAAAGRRALEGDDAALAAGLLGRALDRLIADDPGRADLALDWCEALLAAGDVTGAAEAIDELGRLVDDSDRLRAWHACFAGHQTVLTAPQELSATADIVAVAATELASLNDAAGEANGHFVHALALARLGRVGACEASLDRALAAARRAGDRRRANTVLAIAPLASLWGPSPVTRASGRCLDVVRVLRITQGAPAVEAVALSCQGVLEALRGRTEAAHRMITSARKMVEELGIAQRLFETDVFAGFVALLEGDAPAAERILRGAYDGLRDLGLGIDTARAAALLARAVLAQDRSEEAEMLSHESESLAGDDLKAAIAWRGVRAEALARRGEHHAATQLAKAAVEIAASTDALLDHADARLALAAALRAAGRSTEADAEDRHAIELWEAKGATLLAEQARRAGTPAAPPVAAHTPHVVHAPRRRSVRPNCAIEATCRTEAAVAARDEQALAAVYRRDVEIVDHQHGLEYGRDAILERFRAMMRESTDGALRHEPLATLGDFVALCRLRITASAAGGHGVPLGAADVTNLIVIEADEQGCARRIDVFGEDAMTSAVVRLYECHASSLPEGERRSRADRVAQTLRALRTPFDSDVLAPVLDAGVRTVDHRTLGTWSARGAHAVLEQIRGLRDVSLDAVVLDEDVLAVEPDALLAQRLHAGTERVGGGVYERQFLLLVTFGADGRLNRWEFFDVGDEAQALARFEALTLGAPVHARVRRRLRPNAASRLMLGIEAGFTARDRSAIEALLSEPVYTVEHPTGATYEREGQLESIERMLRLPNLEFRLELLATLGEGLCLARRRVTASGTAGGRFDVAEYEMDHVVLGESDAYGRLRRSEVFAADHLGDAIARLYERHAELLPDGPVRQRAATTAHAAAFMLTRSREYPMEDVMAPDLDAIDHRIVGHELVGQFSSRWAESWEDLARELTFCPNDVLGLSSEALLRLTTTTGVWKVSGGVFETSYYALSIFGSDGRQVRVEFFDVGQEARALARFDELTEASEGRLPTRGPVRRVRGNRATATRDRFVVAAEARDAAALAATLSDSLLYKSHPTGVTYGKAEAMASWSGAFQAERFAYEVEPLATLGESLALGRHRASMPGLAGEGFTDFGPSQMDVVVVTEDTGTGFQRAEEFAPDRVGDAIVRFYEMYAEQQPEGPARNRGMAIARAIAAFNGPIDPDRIAAVMDPTSRNADHRVVGTWTTKNAAEVLRHYRQQLELVPDFAGRLEDVLALEPDALLARMSFFGTARESGGAFENRLLVVFTFSADGRLGDTEVFEAEQESEALARFAALADGKGRKTAFENAAYRANAELLRRFNARDWPGAEACLSSALVFDDRRPMRRLSVGLEGFLEQLRFLFEVPDSRFGSRLLATRGDRHALSAVTFEGTVAAGGGPLEWDEDLVLAEIDGEGRLVSIVLFAPEDLDAAYAELDTRYEAGEAATPSNNWLSISGFVRAVERRDWDAVRALCGEDFVERDHRGLAVLGGTEGADAWVENFRSLVELAPDTIYRAHHVLEAACGYFVHGSWYGTREGGPYELQVNAVLELDDEGRFRRADMYDDAVAGAAFARLAELDREAVTRRVVAASRETPATQCMDRFWSAYQRAFETGEWETMREACAPGAVFDDRRRMALVSGGIDLIVASLQERARVGARPRWETVALGGERVLVQRVLWSGGPNDGPFEIEYLAVVECDADGALTAALLFDTDDERATQQEAWTRWAAIEPDVAGPLRLVGAYVDAFNAKSLEGFRAICTDDFVCDDHRLAGVGRIEGLEPYLNSVAALWEMTPVTFATIDWEPLALAPNAVVVSSRRAGTVPGGGDFESPVVSLFVVDQGRATRIEMFDVDARDEALARFGALRSVPVAPPPRFANSATRAVDRGAAALAARAWDGFAALMAPGFRHYDRTRMAQLESDGREWLAAFRRIVEMTSAPPAYRLLATRGERLALFEMLWRGAGGDVGPSEIDWRLIVEVNDRGEHAAIVVYDADDLDAAYAELDARYEAEQGDRLPASWTLLRRWVRAVADRDWEAVASLCAHDFVEHDHRGLSLLGVTQGVEPWIQVLRAVSDLAPDSVFRIHHFIPSARGYYEEGGFCGTRDGGPFEIVLNALVAIDDRGLLARVDVYDDDRVFASPRWAELGMPDPPTARESVGLDAPGPTAASLWLHRFRSAFNARDWDGLSVLFAADGTYEDRQRLARVSGGPEMAFSSIRARVEAGFLVERVELLGTAGDRVAIQRMLWASGGDEGRSEVEILVVQEVDEAGRLVASINFDLDDRRAAEREASARWAAIESDKADTVATVRIPPNAAARYLERWKETLRTKGAEATGALLDPSFVSEDRRRLFRTTVDRATEGTNCRWLVEGGWRPETTLLATAGDRLVLQRWLWTCGHGDARSEVEHLEIDELGESGRLVRAVLLDAEDRAAASRELLERYVVTGADGAPQGSSTFEAAFGWNEHDLERVRRGLTDDFVVDDRRLAGMGRLEGADAYIESVAALFELIPDAQMEFLFFAAVEKHGRVSVHRTWGTNTEGGEVESFFALVSLYRDGKLASFELFEVEHLDRALARLEELRP